MELDHDEKKTVKENKALCEQTCSFDYDKIVSLQIGERKFITKIGTLTQHNNQNYFSKLFNGNFEKNPTFDGSYFIDRNGDIFQYILEYLRRNTLIFSDYNNILLQKILNEAQFYMIQPLIKQIQQQTEKQQPSSWLSSSEILSVDEQNKMKDLFIEDDIEFVWKLSRSAWCSYSEIKANYNINTGNKETIILIQDTAGNAFGIKSDVGIGSYSDYYSNNGQSYKLSELHKIQNFIYFNVRDVNKKIAPFQVLGTGNELMTNCQIGEKVHG